MSRLNQQLKITLLASSLWLLASFVPENVKADQGRLYFNPASTTVSVGESFDVRVMFDTDGAEAGGVGARILYDPAYFEALRVEPSEVFDDYPLAARDNVSGLVSISGVVGSRDDLYTGVGELGVVTFRAKAPGSESIRFEFVPGDTRDSNIAVMYGNGDILSTVDNLSVEIEVGTGSDTVTTDDSTTDSTNDSTQTGSEESNSVEQTVEASSGEEESEQGGIVEKVLTFFGFKNKNTTTNTTTATTDSVSTSGTQTTKNTDSVASDETVSVGDIDPYEPITRQDAITDAHRVQTSVEGNEVVIEKSQKSPIWGTVVLIFVVLLIVAGGVWLYLAKKNKGPGRRKSNPRQTEVSGQKTPPMTNNGPPKPTRL